MHNNLRKPQIGAYERKYARFLFFVVKCLLVLLAIPGFRLVKALFSADLSPDEVFFVFLQQMMLIVPGVLLIAYLSNWACALLSGRLVQR